MYRDELSAAEIWEGMLNLACVDGVDAADDCELVLDVNSPFVGQQRMTISLAEMEADRLYDERLAARTGLHRLNIG